MPRKPAEWSTHMATFYKSLYYPAAGADMETLMYMLDAFKGIHNIILSSFYYMPGFLPFDKNPYKIWNCASIRYLYDKLKKYFLLRKLKKYTLGGIDIDKVSVLTHKGKRLDLLFISSDMFLIDTPAFVKSPAVHIVKCPGDSGYLSWQADFYPKIIADMKIADLMLVKSAELPLGKTAVTDIGLEEIEIHSLILDGWTVYRKYQVIAFDVIRKIWLADHGKNAEYPKRKIVKTDIKPALSPFALLDESKKEGEYKEKSGLSSAVEHKECSKTIDVSSPVSLSLFSAAMDSSALWASIPVIGAAVAFVYLYRLRVARSMRNALNDYRGGVDSEILMSIREKARSIATTNRIYDRFEVESFIEDTLSALTGKEFTMAQQEKFSFKPSGIDCKELLRQKIKSLLRKEVREIEVRDIRSFFVRKLEVYTNLHSGPIATLIYRPSVYPYLGKTIVIHNQIVKMFQGKGIMTLMYAYILSKHLPEAIVMKSISLSGMKLLLNLIKEGFVAKMAWRRAVFGIDVWCYVNAFAAKPMLGEQATMMPPIDYGSSPLGKDERVVSSAKICGGIEIFSLTGVDCELRITPATDKEIEEFSALPRCTRFKLDSDKFYVIGMEYARQALKLGKVKDAVEEFRLIFNEFEHGTYKWKIPSRERIGKELAVLSLQIDAVISLVEIYKNSQRYSIEHNDDRLAVGWAYLRLGYVYQNSLNDKEQHDERICYIKAYNNFQAEYLDSLNLTVRSKADKGIQEAKRALRIKASYEAEVVKVTTLLSQDVYGLIRFNLEPFLRVMRALITDKLIDSILEAGKFDPDKFKDAVWQRKKDGFNDVESRMDYGTGAALFGPWDLFNGVLDYLRSGKGEVIGGSVWIEITVTLEGVKKGVPAGFRIVNRDTPVVEGFVESMDIGKKYFVYVYKGKKLSLSALTTMCLWMRREESLIISVSELPCQLFNIFWREEQKLFSLLIWAGAWPGPISEIQCAQRKRGNVESSHGENIFIIG